MNEDREVNVKIKRTFKALNVSERLKMTKEDMLSLLDPAKIGTRMVFNNVSYIYVGIIKNKKELEEYYINSTHISQFSVTKFLGFDEMGNLVIFNLKMSVNKQEAPEDIFAPGLDSSEHDRRKLLEEIKIYDDDDYMMRTAKEIMIHSEMTNGQFKRLCLSKIPTKKTSDVHNFLHRIKSTDDHTLSMDKIEMVLVLIEMDTRFVAMLEKFKSEANKKAREIAKVIREKIKESSND